MPQIELGILQPQRTPPVVKGRDWNKEVEPKLRAAALRRMFLSTQMLAIRDPQLHPMVTPVADGYAVFHGPDAMSSFAREVGTSRPISGKELSILEQFYADHSCPVRVWVSNRTHSSLLEMLHGHGYATRSHSVNWFRSLDSDPIHCQQPNIEVLPVTGQLHENWIQTVAAGFFEDNESVPPTEISASFFDLFFALGCAPDDQAFLARIDGDLVGGAVLNVADGIAMLRTASTRFAHRNAGVEQALLAARLTCAREQGARMAVSQTPPSGPSAHNLRKFGFQPFRFGGMMEKSIA
jgi:GNAT superfamily N-acetyltransferase